MVKTSHILTQGDARSLSSIDSESVHLVVTSPPYPLVEMWDDSFSSMSGEAKEALAAGDGSLAFEACHRELDKAWKECFRVLRPGGIACINIGDATRTFKGVFQIYPNHARSLMAMCSIGFSPLPDILWRKPTNAPNKFMGSGMLPAGAYVTYEHEYVLILRKGTKRSFATPEAKENRRRSAFFWEERNIWFSDVWSDLRGTSQPLDQAASRERSGAYPIELAYRLINMYSVFGDYVLDPFAGTGTTGAAAIAAGRSSRLIEFESSLLPSAQNSLHAAVNLGTKRAGARLKDHLNFVVEREEADKKLKHRNEHYGFPVVTAQERDLVLMAPMSLTALSENNYCAAHHPAEMPREELQMSLFGSA